MGIVVDIRKQPYEEFTTFMGFANHLGIGETITTATFTSRNEATNLDTTAAIKKGTEQIVGTTVYQNVKAGASDESHILTYRIVTSAGNKFEGDHRLVIRET